MDLVIGPKGIRQLTSQDAKVESNGVGRGQAPPSSRQSVLPLLAASHPGLSHRFFHPIADSREALGISSCGEAIWDNGMGSVGLYIPGTVPGTEGLETGVVKVGEGKREGYYCCSSGNSSCFFNGIWGYHVPGSQKNEVQPWPYQQLGMTVANPDSFEAHFSFCKGLGLGDPSNLNSL